MSPSFETAEPGVPHGSRIQNTLRWQADMLRWQQVKITDLQRQVLSLNESKSILEQQNRKFRDREIAPTSQASGKRTRRIRKFG